MMTESVTVTVHKGTESSRPTTTTTTTSTSTGGPTVSLSLNPIYFRTIPGIIKLAQLLLGIICMACGSPGYGAGHWFLFVAVTAFIMSLIWSIVYLFSVRESLKIPINWIVTELLNTGIYTVLYFSAFVAELAAAYWAKYIAAGIFGIFNTIAYAAGTYFLYLEYKNGQQ